MSLVYHYTSINTLALILKNGTIRLNCLKNVDDMNECLTDDYGNLANYLYASSWTEDRLENISLWNMYTPHMAGIRIGLPPDMLDITLDEYDLITNGIVKGEDEEKEILIFGLTENVPHPIEYISSEDKKNLLDLSSKDEATIKIDANNLGLKKDKQWEFQKESRFVVLAVRMNKKYSKFDEARKAGLMLALLNKEPISLNHIDLHVKKEALDQMHVLLGPHCNESDRIIVESLLKNFCPSNKNIVQKSALKIRHR